MTVYDHLEMFKLYGGLLAARVRAVWVCTLFFPRLRSRGRPPLPPSALPRFLPLFMSPLFLGSRRFQSFHSRSLMISTLFQVELKRSCWFAAYMYYIKICETPLPHDVLLIVSRTKYRNRVNWCGARVVPGLFRKMPKALPGIISTSLRHYKYYSDSKLKAVLYAGVFFFSVYHQPGTAHFGKWYRINPVPPHCDVIPWRFGSTPRTQMHTHRGPTTLFVFRIINGRGLLFDLHVWETPLPHEWIII